MNSCMQLIHSMWWVGMVIIFPMDFQFTILNLSQAAQGTVKIYISNIRAVSKRKYAFADGYSDFPEKYLHLFFKFLQRIVIETVICIWKFLLEGYKLRFS